VIAALQATEALSREAIDLLPSFVPGLAIQSSSFNVLRLSQESPLRELFLLTLIVAFQDDLKAEVPPMLEHLLGVTISDQYDTIATVAFMIVLFYGAGFAVDAVARTVAGRRVHETFDDVAEDLSKRSGLSHAEIKMVLESRFARPPAMRRLARNAVDFFIPSKRDGSASVTLDRKRIEPSVVSEVPFAKQLNDASDFNKYMPLAAARILLHMQDRDRKSLGWAAVVPDVSQDRLKLKLMDDVRPSDLWNKDEVTGDIVVVHSLTSAGFVPSEIHLSRIISD
jgi:hypothetical protein